MVCIAGYFLNVSFNCYGNIMKYGFLSQWQVLLPGSVVKPSILLLTRSRKESGTIQVLRNADGGGGGGRGGVSAFPEKSVTKV